jgi:sigma-B regulation protein RsbU (phosphoserine phosphatase)
MNQTQLELEDIGRLQQMLLPNPLPQFPGWELAVHYDVGKSGGGDYYDVLQIDADHIGIAIADVTGHGPAAAVLTTMIRMLLHSCPITSGKQRGAFCNVEVPCTKAAHVVLTHLNQAIVENSLEEQFVTMIFGILNLATGEFEFSIAGHPPPCWWQTSNGTLATLPDVGGPPLGLRADACYASTIVRMSPGDLVVLYTDGLTEANAADGKMFGCGRLKASIRSAANESADSIKSSVIGRLEVFLNGVKLQDDLALLVLKRVIIRERLPSEQFIG